jgi:hypothetical protein
VSQHVLISLLQQLGSGLATADQELTALSLNWIQAALLVLDVEHPDIKPFKVSRNC